ncbi:MAG TPA: amidohydrolase [Bacillota bacterium]
MNTILEGAGSLAADVRGWRRHLHQHPELSFQEKETTAFIEARLRQFGIETLRPTPTGVVGVIQGGQPGRTVALRADIDALPIHEENNVPYRSTRDGVMHACGHDAHTAMLLGAARVLAEHRSDLRGCVKLLFQPAEELPPGGAMQFLEAGVLDDVDAIAGLHVMSNIPAGKASIRTGVMMAHSDRFTIEIEGHGGHGASPHQTRDATLMAAQLVVNLQTIVSRRVNPSRPAVVTVGRIEAGSTFNVIAQRAQLLGTTRCFDDDVRELLRREIERVAEHTCAMNGGSCRVDYDYGYPALVNDPGVTETLRGAAGAVLGPANVLEQEPILGGEDFAHYTRKLPGAFLFLGAGNEQIGAAYPHHHPRFEIDESILVSGVKILLKAALDLL